MSNKKKVIEKSSDFRSYYAETVGIIDSSLSGNKLFDLTFLNREPSPVIIKSDTSGENDVLTMENITDLKHVCTIKISKKQLIALGEVIDRIIKDTEDESEE
ncbi:hypothetical protein KDV89_15120 [Providencia stuartii]|uniref:hypothetical protein n=1 Tax=Providencia stuartii TaxID=588 RepID=UPI00073D092F|nr:hypothetical protein [Providencia stuartii]KSX99298.1 hypothetical protein APT95_06740 [Providencia stuartii]